VAPLGQFCRFQAALFPEVIAPHPAGNGGNASGISTVGCTATTSGLCWLTRSASCVMFGFAIYGTTPLALQHCRSQQQAKPFPYPPQSLDFQGVLLLAGCRPLARLAADLWPGWAGWPWLPTSGPAGLAGPGITESTLPAGQGGFRHFRLLSLPPLGRQGTCRTVRTKDRRSHLQESRSLVVVVGPHPPMLPACHGCRHE